MPDSRLLDLIDMPDQSTLGLATTPDPRALELACLLDSRCLDLTIHIKLKQTTNNQMTIMHFSCQEKKNKEKTQTIDHRQ